MLGLCCARAHGRTVVTADAHRHRAGCWAPQPLSSAKLTHSEPCVVGVVSLAVTWRL